MTIRRAHGMTCRWRYRFPTTGRQVAVDHGARRSSYTYPAVVLRPGDRFSIELVALGFEEPSLIEYAWKMEGLDKAWNYRRILISPDCLRLVYPAHQSQV